MGRAWGAPGIRTRRAEGSFGASSCCPVRVAVADHGRRSRAWGVLAVSLALMALVTALSSTTGHRGPARPKESLARSTQSTRPPTRTRATSGRHRHTATSPSNGHAAAPRRTSAEKTARRAAGGPAGEAARGSAGTRALGGTGVLASAPSVPAAFGTSGVAPSSPIAATNPLEEVVTSQVLPASSATSTPSRETSSSSSAAPSPSGPSRSTQPRTDQASGAYPGRGSIVAPATSASYAAMGGGIVSAQATWSGSGDLELDISCPAGLTVTHTGTSGLSLEIDDGHGAGTCTVTLSLLPGTHADVSFTLVIDPAP